MSAGRSDFTSPFDDMLDQSRRQFDDLYGGATGATPPPRRPAAEPKSDRQEVSEDTRRFLDDGYGDRWRYEVSERRREDDEVIVLCKLIVGDGSVSKSQFGSAPVGGQRAGLKGSAGGIAFALGTEAEAGSGGGDPEQAAYRQALARALANCAEML